MRPETAPDIAPKQIERFLLTTYLDWARSREKPPEIPPNVRAHRLSEEPGSHKFETILL